jgi:hypothetical protein
MTNRNASEKSGRPMPATHRLESKHDRVRISERFWTASRTGKVAILVACAAFAPRLEPALQRVYAMHGIEALIGAVLLLTGAVYTVVAAMLNVVSVEFDGRVLRRKLGPLPLFGGAEMSLSDVLLFKADYHMTRSDDGGWIRGPRTLGELRASPIAAFFSGVGVEWTVSVESVDGQTIPLFYGVKHEAGAEALRDALRELARA